MNESVNQLSSEFDGRRRARGLAAPLLLARLRPHPQGAPELAADDAVLRCGRLRAGGLAGASRVSETCPRHARDMPETCPSRRAGGRFSRPCRRPPATASPSSCRRSSAGRLGCCPSLRRRAVLHGSVAPLQSTNDAPLTADDAPSIGSLAPLADPAPCEPLLVPVGRSPWPLTARRPLRLPALPRPRRPPRLGGRRSAAHPDGVVEALGRCGAAALCAPFRLGPAARRRPPAGEEESRLSSPSQALQKWRVVATGDS